MDIYGSSRIENMRGFRESQGMFREAGLSGSAALEGAKLAAPVLAKLNFLASSLDEESAATMKAANLNMLRYVESSGGLKSAEAFNRIADFGYKLNVSSGGTVDWAQLRQFKARAGAAGFNLSEEAMARLEPTIAEMKGGAAGYGLSTAYQRLTGAIRIPNQVVHELVDTGVWDQSKLIFNQNGGIKKFLGNPLGAEKTDLLSTNPELFYEKYIRPMYQRMGFDFAEIARQNVMILGRTGGQNASLWENQLAAIHRSIDALQKVQGIDASVTIAKSSLTGEQKEFEAAWKDFKTEFGTTMLPVFTSVLKDGAAILRMLGPDKAHLHQHWVANPITFRGKSGGRWVDDYISPEQVAQTLFSDDARAARFAALGGSSKPTSVDSHPNNFVAPLSMRSVTVQSTINLDGKKVGEAMSKHVIGNTNSPQTGTSIFDDSLTPLAAGGVGSAW